MAANNDLVDYYYSDSANQFVGLSSLRAYDATAGSITCNVTQQGMFGAYAAQPVNALFVDAGQASASPSQAEVNAIVDRINALMTGLKALGIIASS